MWKHLLSCVLAFLCAVSTVTFAEPRYLELGDSFHSIPNQYIVIFKQHSDVAGHYQWSSSAGISIKKIIEIGELRGYLAETNLSGFLSLMKREEVDYIEPNAKFHSPSLLPQYIDDISNIQNGNGLNAEQFNATWGLDRIDQRDLPLDGVYRYNDTAGNSTLAFIVDSGIYLNHTEYIGRAFWGGNFIDDGIDDDCFGTGTAVAGVVGGTNVGVAKETFLIAVKVLDCNGTGTLESVLGGMQFVASVSQNATFGSVAQLSFLGGVSQSINDAVQALIDVGVNVVSAAGDASDSSCNYSPSSAPDGITVGATTISDGFASFSNSGNCTHILAPGEFIITSFIGDPNSYVNASSTFLAAPFVGGAICIKNDGGILLPSEVKSWILSEATPDVITGAPADTANLLLYSPPPTSSGNDTSISASGFPLYASGRNDDYQSPLVAADDVDG